MILDIIFEGRLCFNTKCECNDELKETFKYIVYKFDVVVIYDGDFEKLKNNMDFNYCNIKIQNDVFCKTHPLTVTITIDEIIKHPFTHKLGVNNNWLYEEKTEEEVKILDNMTKHVIDQLMNVKQCLTNELTNDQTINEILTFTLSEPDVNLNCTDKIFN